MVTCPSCDCAISTDDRFCEVCGHELRGSVEPDTRWLSSAGDRGGCLDGLEHLPGSGCQRCGQRLAAGRNRVELRLGELAGVTDRGRCRHRNEDAVALGRTDSATAAIVCDGVASSSRADTAARAAVRAGMRMLLQALAEGQPAPVATQNAARAAVHAVAKLSRPENLHNPPSCTYVSAVVTAEAVTVGWIGDSRAYWLAGREGAGSSCLTVDDTLIGRWQAAGGGPQARLDPQAAALIRWVGADAYNVEPHIATFDPPGSGRVLLCSDGLSRYLSAAEDLAAAATHDPPEVAAGRLTQLALDAGGQDNITIVIAPFPPEGDGRSSWAEIPGEPGR